VIFSALYGLLSIARYNRFADTSLDLGIFTEAVRHYAHFQAPIVDIKGTGFNLLGYHFSPIIALIAPAYWIYPSAATLLGAQAVLIGLSVLPLCRSAIKMLGRRKGIGLALAYGLSWGLQRAADNTFHEIAFALPLIAMVLEHLLAKRWTSSALWCLPLIFVKEDMGLTVAAVGAYLLLRRQHRLGLALIGYGVSFFALTVYVIIPAMNANGHYYYWTKIGNGGVFSVLSRLFSGADVKLGTLFAIFAITGMLALRSPLSILLVPTIAWRFVSTDTAYWGTAWHYNAALMPIVFAALLDGIVVCRESKIGVLRSYARNMVPAVLAISLTFTISGSLPLRDLLSVSSYEHGPRGAAAHQALAEIPDGTSVETNVALISHLSNRCDVFWVGNTGPTVPNYIALDLSNGWSAPLTDPVGYAQSLHPGVHYTMISNVDGYAVMKRQP
jgi:uncharacterized membrane protein